MSTENEGADISAPEAAPDVDALAAETPEVTTEGAEDTSGEDTTAATDAEAPKPKPTAKDRIDELTAKRREAEREAEYWKAKALQAPTTPAPAPQAAPEEQEPNPQDYEHGELDAKFIRDHATFHATKAFEDRLAKLNSERSAQAAQTAWQAKEQAALTKFPDYEDKVARGRWACSQDMATAIKESDVGPDLAYHLASNPDEAQRIASLTPHSQIRELGKLEAKLSAPTTPQPKLVSSAPDPIPSVRGSGGRFEAAPDTGDFAAFERLADKTLGS